VLAGAAVRAATVYRYCGSSSRKKLRPSNHHNFLVRGGSQSYRMPPSKSVTLPDSPATIIEVTENDDTLPIEKATEYSSLLPHRNSKGNGRRPFIKKYKTCEKTCDKHHKYKSSCNTCNHNDSSAGEESNTESASATSDEVSSNTSSTFTSNMSPRQLKIFCLVMMSTCASSLTVCLFPPFFPAVAESKGVRATGYGLIIGTNCLVAFLVTPFIGNNLNNIGVKFAYICGLILGGVCCILSGLLEFIHPGPVFLVVAVSIRIVHAISNAFVITSSFTYNACEFPNSMAKDFAMMVQML